MSARLANLALAVSGACVAVPAAHGAVIYREQFGRVVGVGGNQSINQFDWAQHATATATNNGGTNTSSNTPAKPQDVGNVNAGEPADPLANGYAFRDSATSLFFWTPEFTFNPADYEAGSIRFTWYQGNANGNAASGFDDPQTFRVAVRIGELWYLDTTSFGNISVNAGGNFQLGDENGNGDVSGNHGAELKTLPYDPTPASGGWEAFTFDGTFDLSTHTGAAGTQMVVGAPIVGDLPAGPITGFGLYSPEPQAGNRRFDTFQIEGTPIPEPAGLALAFSAGALAAMRRRR